MLSRASLELRIVSSSSGSAWPVVSVMTCLYAAVFADPPEYPATTGFFANGTYVVAGGVGGAARPIRDSEKKANG